ncbi:P-loop containing nucleoside triphosphate hydrolase protein [Lophiotrema nucula]|uniref:P-loop containing nucleoside triphosphate hydrolase protein n=1 Tax=Lophiotrema nucula TaxID=690887 RepID=A0A6A5Z2F4_9PLEO|nr:P-loop containing nucleoside triphosphate hydrolase protein [Lophiotrema nucula]
MPGIYHANTSHEILRPIAYPSEGTKRDPRPSWYERLRESRRHAAVYSDRSTETTEPKISDKSYRQSNASAHSLDTIDALKLEQTPEKSSSTDAKPWHKHLNPLKWGEVPPVPLERTVCPESTTNPLTKLSFGWMTSLMATGYRRDLKLNDIWIVNPRRNVHSLSEPFQTSFGQRSFGKANKVLLMTLYDTFKRDFWLGGTALLISSICQVLVPFTLRFLLSFVADAYTASVARTPAPDIGRGLGILFGIVFIQLLQSLTTNQFLYHGAMVGAQARAVLTGAIFEKSLKISSRARSAGKGYSDGRITNLMSTDVARIDLAAGMLHMVWAAPMTILACFALLIVNITYSAVVGFSLLVISVPALTIATKSLTAKRKAISTITDSRVSLTTEVLKSIRFVKYNAWETSFLSKLRGLRKKETKLVAKLLTTRNAIYVISISTPVFAAMLSFIVYAMTGHTLGVAPIFSSLALFNAVRIPLSLLPIVIGQFADGMACLKRVEEFLLAEEHQEEINWDMEAKDGIKVRNASFVWEKSASSEDATKEEAPKKSESKPVTEIKMVPPEPEPFSVKNINLSVGRNELIAVIGSVGSGKTSFLSALAGEMRKTHGQVSMGSWSRAFCPQQAWLQNTSVKDNILFGKPMEGWWYDTVKNACCLDADLKQLPAGEDTEIGERGVNLSGGQRQRINLARAIYSKSDIVLLDDPLSAVDVHVRKHMFQHAICGLLQDKCRILATHQLHILSKCDRILWLDNGKIKALDTFLNLMRDDPDFRVLMASTTQEDRPNANGTTRSKQDTDPKPAANDASADAKPGGKLMKEENRGEGHVSWAVYKSYMASSGHLLLGLIPVILLVLAQTANAVMGLWLGFWTSNRFALSRNNYVAIYVCLAISQALLMFLFTASISNLGSISSRRTLDRATEKVMRSPQSFHDTQPLGRIINRLSRDADVVDNQLPDALRMFLYTMVLITSVIAMLIYYFPYFAAALVPIILLFLFATSYFRVTARSLKRHEAVLRGKMFARFSESVSGVSTIRAFGLQTTFVHSVRSAIDDMNAAYYLTNSSQRWLATRLDLVANTMVLTVGLLVVAKRNVLHPSISGVLLAYLLSMIHVIQLVVRQLAEVQNGMNSMERLHEYATALETEPEHQSNAISVTEAWPLRGEITFSNIHMRYRPHLPFVLDDLNLKFRGGEKIGIVGRTGAGKSSITTALFRIVELSKGSICVDGFDISRLALKDLRKRVAIITQDPTLFKGTIRSNLDPFDEYSDLDLHLRKTGLLDEERREKLQLDTAVEESGANFSLGQRQLLALARALLKDSKIMVCDEATSSVDLETDAKVQRVMSEAFKGKTVITIAHRLTTILHYDRVCVMDKGKIVEVGAPLELWERGGEFRRMCEGNGVVRESFGRK